jgi:hypothetical protein
VIVGAKIMQIGGDFMCFQPGSSAQLEADLLAVAANSPGKSNSGSGVSGATRDIARIFFH